MVSPIGDFFEVFPLCCESFLFLQGVPGITTHFLGPIFFEVERESRESFAVKDVGSIFDYTAVSSFS